jgi:hypothetical protein
MNQSDPNKQKKHSNQVNPRKRGATSGQDDEARMTNEGGTEGQVGDRRGPGAGYDGEPVQVKNKGGVS